MLKAWGWPNPSLSYWWKHVVRRQSPLTKVLCVGVLVTQEWSLLAKHIVFVPLTPISSPLYAHDRSVKTAQLTTPGLPDISPNKLSYCLWHLQVLSSLSQALFQSNLPTGCVIGLVITHISFVNNDCFISFFTMLTLFILLLSHLQILVQC